MQQTIAFKVNGKDVSVVTDGDRPLLEVLREELELTGTKYGCGIGACGACTSRPLMTASRRRYFSRTRVSRGILRFSIRLLTNAVR